MRAEITLLGSADGAEVHDAVVSALVDYFHPLRGGEEGLGWPFGGTIHYSRVYQRVFSVPGVASVSRLVIVLDDEEQPECTDVPIAAHGLLYSREHTIVILPDDGEDT